jgi:peptidoglycan lytic transglycosylase
MSRAPARVAGTSPPDIDSEDMESPSANTWARAAVTAAAIAAAASCATTQRAPGHPAPEVGMASYYGQAHQGKRTASGERFDRHALTAAHRTLPFGSRVKVTNLGNGRSVVVRINDRGPFIENRVIDLSEAAARELRFLGSGTTRVRLEVLDTGR